MFEFFHSPFSRRDAPFPFHRHGLMGLGAFDGNPTKNPKAHNPETPDDEMEMESLENKKKDQLQIG